MDEKIIIYLGGFELPDKNAAAHRVLSNGKILRELNFRVVFVGVDKSLHQDIDIRKTKCSVSGFETWSIPYPNSRKSWIKFISNISSIETLVKEVYDNNIYAFICYNYPFLSQLKISRKCKKHRIFHLADATEWYEGGGGGLLFRMVKWLDTNLRMRYLHPKADGIITTSKYLTEFYSKKDCITVELPTLYDVDILNENTRSIIVKNSKIVNLVYTGVFSLARINQERTNLKDRLDLIIILLGDVYQYNSNFKLDIYGITLESYLSVFPEHDSIIKKLSRCVEFHGRKPHTEIIEKIKGSDFTIFLRNIRRVILAGFPSKFSESISCGTPVITNKMCNIEDYVLQGKNCFLISLNDRNKQLNKMMKILNLSREELLKMKQYCRESDMFSYRNYLKTVEDFLAKLESKTNEKTSNH